jgi:hypothetical protein
MYASNLVFQPSSKLSHPPPSPLHCIKHDTEPFGVIFISFIDVCVFEMERWKAIQDEDNWFEATPRYIDSPL